MATSFNVPKSYTGSCHCGNLRYRVSLALDPVHPEANRCNCSLCTKTGFAGIHIPASDFTLVSPSSTDELTDYRFGSKAMHHFFCKICGVRCMFSGIDADDGKEFYSVNALTFDHGQGEGEVNLTKIKMLYWDGKGENWAAGPKETPYPGGCV